MCDQLVAKVPLAHRNAYLIVPEEVNPSCGTAALILAKICLKLGMCRYRGNFRRIRSRARSLSLKALGWRGTCCSENGLDLVCFCKVAALKEFANYPVTIIDGTQHKVLDKFNSNGEQCNCC